MLFFLPSLLAVSSDPLMCGQNDLQGVNTTMVHYQSEGLVIFPCYGRYNNTNKSCINFLMPFPPFECDSDNVCLLMLPSIEHAPNVSTAQCAACLSNHAMKVVSVLCCSESKQHLFFFVVFPSSNTCWGPFAPFTAPVVVYCIVLCCIGPRTQHSVISFHLFCFATTNH